MMMRDYARKQEYLSPPPQSGGLTFGLLILCIILIPSGLFYWHYHHRLHQQPLAKVANTSKHLAHTEPKKVVEQDKAEAKSPEYDFYTLLPEMKVQDSKKETSLEN